MRLNIAICDDDKSFMENLEKMLISYSLQFDIDIHVDKYQNGSALLSAYDSSQSSPYQVLMLDIEMPGENGISIAEKIKHTKDFDVLIVLSATTQNICWIHFRFIHIISYKNLLITQL